MPRTPIPEYLVHDPSEVKQNAERFDDLCRLAEDAALPVVQQALIRETSVTGAEVLTDETKHALEGLLEEVAGLKDAEVKEMLCNVQRSLSHAMPDPDDAECVQHAKEFSQTLMSTWLEILRKAEEEQEIVQLDDYLLPEDNAGRFKLIMQRFVPPKPKMPEDLSEAAALFAVTEEDVTTVLTTLRVKLFSQPFRVDLPFDLGLIGAPSGVMLTNDRTFEIVVAELERQEKEKREREEQERQRKRQEERKQFEDWPIEVGVGMVVVNAAAFGSVRAKVAAQKLSKPLSARNYRCFKNVASLKPKHLDVTNLNNRVRHAIARSH